MPNRVGYITFEHVVYGERPLRTVSRFIAFTEYEDVFRHYVRVVVTGLLVLNKRASTSHTAGDFIPYYILMEIPVGIA